MAEFCETCPIRGTCTPKKELRMLRLVLSKGERHIYVSRFFDRDGSSSEIIESASPDDEIFSRVEACEQPILELKGVIRKRSLAVCQGLGQATLVATDSDVAVLFGKIDSDVQQLGRELWDEI